MNLQRKPLEEAVGVGEALRVAPARQGKPAALFWKFWVDGNEVYATSRMLGSTAKISVHESGQIHIRLEKKLLQRLAPPLLLGDGQWLHAFELRFLLSADAYSPPPEKLKKNRRAFLIEVPTDAVLIMNLLVGQPGNSPETALPHELLPAAKPLWRATLKDQRPVVLTARVREMDKKNRGEITFIRHQLNPRFNVSEPPAIPPYTEVRRVVWDPAGGNVVLVVPMGKEALRVQPSTDPSAASGADSRTVAIASPNAGIEIAAPNGAIVGTLSITGVTGELTLTKNVTVRGSLGTVMLSMSPANLIFGESFGTPRILCPAVPTIDGAQPRNWEYAVFCCFDGAALKAEVRQLSSALRNANVPIPMTNVSATEEVVVIAPVNGLVLLTTADAPESSAVLESTFLLVDI